MTNLFKTERFGNAALLMARVALGAAILSFGADKIGHDGITYFVKLHSKSIPDFIPLPIGQTFLYAVPYIAVLAGAMVVVGFLTRTASAVAAVMLLCFSLMARGILVREPSGAWPQVHPNIVYVGAAILLVATGAGSISLDRRLLKSKD